MGQSILLVVFSAGSISSSIRQVPIVCVAILPFAILLAVATWCKSRTLQAAGLLLALGFNLWDGLLGLNLFNSLDPFRYLAFAFTLDSGSQLRLLAGVLLVAKAVCIVRGECCRRIMPPAWPGLKNTATPGQ